jgi:predicted TIM-barrel fold metal-dependent hydrolase
MIVDAHIHVGRWAHPDFLGRENDLAGTLAALSAAGVDGAALQPSDRCDNAGLLDGALRALDAGFPGPLWIFAWVRPGDDLGWVKRSRADLCGIKLHPSLSRTRASDEAFRPALDLADDLGFAHALDAAAAHTGARFLLGHAGGDTPPLAMGAAESLAERKLPHVRFEISGLREYWVLERTIPLIGPGRYLLASDYPLGHPLMYLGAVQAMAIPEAARRLIRGENAVEFLGPPLGGRR